MVLCMILIQKIRTGGTWVRVLPSRLLIDYRRCEYIFYRGLYRTAYARVSRGIVTDTELQIGQFVLPKHGHVLANQTEESRLLRTQKADLPEYHVCFLCPFFTPLTIRQWFPMEYYGNEHEGGVNGHYYHVFDTVRTSISFIARHSMDSYLAIILWTPG